MTRGKDCVLRDRAACFPVGAGRRVDFKIQGPSQHQSGKEGQGCFGNFSLCVSILESVRSSECLPAPLEVSDDILPNLGMELELK